MINIKINQVLNFQIQLIILDIYKQMKYMIKTEVIIIIQKQLIIHLINNNFLMEIMEQNYLHQKYKVEVIIENQL